MSSRLSRKYTTSFSIAMTKTTKMSNDCAKPSVTTSSISSNIKRRKYSSSKCLFIFRHSVEKKFIALLLKKMQSYKFLSDMVKIVFSSLEYLLRAIHKDDQYVYFMVCINKEGFLTSKYQFQEDDAPYFANFLKLLARKINED